MFDFATTTFVSILFLVDPPGTIPAFLALTSGQSPARRKRTAFVACLTATLTLAGFAAVGTFLFRHLGLTLPAFQIAGGVVLFLVALDMIRSGEEAGTAEAVGETDRGADVAITPLAIPLLAGPGALATVAMLMAQAPGTAGAAIVYGAIALTGLVSYITLRLASPLQRRLGTVGIHVIGKVLGLVLAGIAVQFILDGLAAAKVVPRVER
jgi:multiple antibiotic resistance protein